MPAELTRGPFTLEEARRAGLTAAQLRGRSWNRIATELYVWTGLTLGPEKLLAAVMRRLPAYAVFSGPTAAFVHGLDFAPASPIYVTVLRQSGYSGRVGLVARRATVRPDDATVLRGLRVTTVERTLADLAQQLPFVEAVVAMDAALYRGLTTLEKLDDWAVGRRRAKGIRRFRSVLAAAEPRAQSPMETRLRLLLVLSGLPRPEAQAELKDEAGRIFARADLYYPQARLAIEYDGGTHRESLLEDNRRQNRVLASGFRLLRFASGDLLRAPVTVVSEVRAALERAA